MYGDSVIVKVIGANRENSTVDFMILKDKNEEIKKEKTHKKSKKNKYRRSKKDKRN